VLDQDGMQISETRQREEARCSTLTPPPAVRPHPAIVWFFRRAFRRGPMAGATYCANCAITPAKRGHFVHFCNGKPLDIEPFLPIACN
jgi:hypothetical protein